VIAGHRYEPIEILNRNHGRYPQAEIDAAYRDLTASLREGGFEVRFMDASYQRNQQELEALGATFGSGKDYLPYWSAKKGYQVDRFYRGAVRGEMQILLSLSGFVVLPHFVKEQLYEDGFVETVIGKHGWIVNRLARYDVAHWPILDLLPEIARVETGEPVFFHLYSAVTHNPYSHNSDCELGYWYTSPDRFREDDRRLMNNSTYCTMERLGQFFARLDAAGVYDSSKIIIVSDHGRSGDDHGYRSGSGYPLLLVKDFGERGQLETSDMPISNADVAAIVCSGVESGCSRIADADPNESSPGERARYYVHVRLAAARDDREPNHVTVLGIYEGGFPDWERVKREHVLAYLEKE
jgi:hypothetical protein